MNKLVFFTNLFLILWASNLQSQTTAQFEATIYVEDAIGNIDSVIVGFDSLATEDLDPEFGEIEIDTPFDSVFEVRGTLLTGQYRYKCSKKIINGAERIFDGPNDWSSGCYGGGDCFIIIRSIHQPVKISWHQSEFWSRNCHSGSLLSNHWADVLSGPYDWNENPANQYFCMAAQDSIVIDLSEEAILEANVNTPVFLDFEVEGVGEQSIYGVRFFHAPIFHWTPCDQFVTSSSIPESEDAIQLFPNPTNDDVRLELPEGHRPEEVSIYNLNGQQVAHFTGLNSSVIPLHNLPKGIYQVIVNQRFTGRVVKL